MGLIEGEDKSASESGGGFFELFQAGELSMVSPELKRIHVEVAKKHDFASSMLLFHKI